MVDTRQRVGICNYMDSKNASQLPRRVEGEGLRHNTPHHNDTSRRPSRHPKPQRHKEATTPQHQHAHMHTCKHSMAWHNDTSRWLATPQHWHTGRHTSMWRRMCITSPHGHA